MRLLILAALMFVFLIGCAYAPSDVADFPVRCESCSSGFFGVKTTVMHCRADQVLATACRTPCRHCGKMLAEPGDGVEMTALSGDIFVTKYGRK